MDGQTLAAWVQAGGSILAIVVAFLVSHLQHRSSLKVLKTQRRDANVSKLEVLFALAEKARTLIEKANAGIQGDLSSYHDREFDSNDLRGLHEAFAAVVLQDLPSGNSVFAILRLKEVTRQMPSLVQLAVYELGEHGGVSPLTCGDSEDLTQATNWAYIKLREDCAAAEQLL
jgi:heme exporter protein D